MFTIVDILDSKLESFPWSFRNLGSRMIQFSPFVKLVVPVSDDSNGQHNERTVDLLSVKHARQESNHLNGLTQAAKVHTGNMMGGTCILSCRRIFRIYRTDISRLSLGISKCAEWS